MTSPLRPPSFPSAVAALVCAAQIAAAVPASAELGRHDAWVAGRYADVLSGENVRLPAAARRDLAERVLLLSTYYKIDSSLLAALVSVESGWSARARSPVGALGYGQLMPSTAAGLDVNAREPYENLDGTARYLRRLLDRYESRDAQTRVRLALASYNAGPAAVTRYGGVPPYRETRRYVARVLRVRASFVAAIANRATSDVATLVTDKTASAGSVRASALLASHRTTTAHPETLDFAAAAPPRTAAVRYETSHSFLARMLGIRRRVADRAAAASHDAPPPSAADVVVLPP